MKILSRNSMMLILLALVFLAPGLAAIYFYQFPHKLMGRSTNKGEFVKPTVKIQSLDSSVKGSASTVKKWHLVLWSPNGCDESCLQPLAQLAQIRLALGRHYYEAELVLLTGQYRKSLSPALLEFVKQNKLLVLQLPPNEINALYAYAKEPQIFIGNSAGFLVLSYVTSVNSDDVYHDLKQLMSVNTN